MVLHLHTEHSFLDGRGRTSEMAEAAKASGWDFCAITDHDECGGHMDWAKACNQVGIKPIFGTEARWLHDIERSREERTSGNDSSHIIILAENQKGLSNLWALSSLAYEPENFYGKPQLEPRLMREYSEGLFASDGCGLTRFADYAENDDIDRARQEWGVLLDIFGDNFYSELHTFQIIDPTPDDAKLNRRIMKMNQMKVKLSQEMGVPLVVVNDCHYAQREQWEEHRLVYNLSTQAWRRDQVDTLGQAADWLMNPDEVTFYLQRHGIRTSIIEEALANTRAIGERCNVEIKPTLSMPRLYATDAEDIAAFRRSIEEGFKRFVVDKGLDEDVYRQRLEYEAKLIVDQGMAGYFNVVADYVMAARSGSWKVWVEPGAKPQPCLCGPGRGSGGGSLVNYVLGITSLDPIKYDLMFERFINPDRPDYPDIDVDFQKSLRPGLKAYLGKRYGEANVVAIGTRSRSGPKQMLKDLWRALGYTEYADLTAMTKIIEQVDTIDFAADPDDLIDEDGNTVEPPTWDEILAEKGGELQPYAKKYPLLFKRLEAMVRLVRQGGVHAAGVLVNTEPILGKVPTRVKKGVRATQFDMNEVAELGGVKDDLLSGRGLDVLAIARPLIYQRHGVWLDYDGFGFGVPEDCPPDKVITFGDEQYSDPAIWPQIHMGQTAGIFQIGTPSGTKQAMRFKPWNLVDLANLASINRPGVIGAGQLEHFLRRRHGEEEITYDHPLMVPITGPESSMYTYGILVYQEQLIRTAREVAGFSAGEAEKLRKGIGKKIAAIIEELKPKFLDGCMANPEFTGQGGTRKVAEKIWASLEAAGKYAFNKSHATGYAMQPCWEIWTKHYYFDEFIVGCLDVFPDKITTFVRECRRRGRPVLAPDVNKSGARFTLTDEGIRFGLTDIRGIGESVVGDIINNAPYISLADFLERTSKSGGRKKGVVDSLIKAGAFDDIEGIDHTGRQKLLQQAYWHRAGSEVAPRKWAGLSYEERDAIVREKWRKKPKDYPTYDFADEKRIVELETELLGTHVSVDPMARYAKMIENICIRHPMDYDDFDTNQRFVVGGEITKIKPHMQRNHRQMAFLTVRYAEEDFDILAFADAYERCKPLLKLGAPVACEVIKLSGGGASLSTLERLDYI